MNKYIPGVGNPFAKILFIGEAPSYEEEIQGIPFVGPAGKIFDDCLRNVAINRHECWVTNVFKYMIVPQVRKKKIPAFVRAAEAGIDVQKSLQELRTEIDQIKPNVIVLLGATALWALTNKTEISKWRGSIIHAWNYKCVPTFHPAHLIHSELATGDYWQKYIIEFDFRRAKVQSLFPHINRPSRNLAVCRNSAQLFDFYERAKLKAKEVGHPIKLSVDIEAIGCIPVCIGLAFTHYEGLSVPLWNKTPIVKISEIPSSDLASIWLMLYKILMDPDFLIIGQNFKYDQDKINRLGFRIPKLFSDTMLKAFCINPELSTSLAFNTSIYTEEPYYKDEGMEFDYTKHPMDDLLLYNAKDAPVTLEIDDSQEPDLIELGLQDFYYNFLMKLPDLYLSIENQGIKLDDIERALLLRKYIAWSERLKFELWKLTGSEVNVASYKQVEILLYEVMKIPRREGTGEEVLTQLLGNIVKKKEQREVLENILEQRRVDKTIGNYLMAMPDYDGRMKTSYFICLDTGRTGTNLLEPPIRPSHEIRDENNKKKKKYIGAAFQVLTKHGDIGGDIRRQYHPDENEIFVQADSSQAEARVVALLADDEETLKLYDTNDVYALAASWFLGGEEKDFSKKILGYECPQRFLGKTLRHAGHLGAKKKRAATEVNTQARKYKIPISISEYEADRALTIFHRKAPKIRGIFHAGIISALEKGRILTAPIPFGIDSKFGGKRTFYERWGDELFRQAYSYLPQRAITDNTKAAALRIRERIPKIKIVIESHDSLLFSMLPKLVDEWGSIIKEEMERPINFENCSLSRHPLIIPCELEIGENYKDLSKFKFKEIV